MLVLAGGAHAQDSYQKPPQAVLKVLNAPVTPRASVGRARDIVLLYEPVLYPPIAELAQPFVRLAGLRIDVANNGPHNAPRFDNLVLKRVADGQQQKVDLPAGFYVSQPFWSPEGHTIAFTHAAGSGVELWLADARTGKAAAVKGVKLNAAFSAMGFSEENRPCHWMPGSKALLCQTIPAGRGEPPKPTPVPRGWKKVSAKQLRSLRLKTSWRTNTTRRCSTITPRRSSP
jgi:hypothetical protein